MNLTSSRKKGFTLIEVLLVVVIIAILASIVIVALNPQRQINQAQNSQRDSDVNALLNAVYQYAIDNGGALPTSITTTAANIGDGTGEVDICDDLVPTYLVAIPFDPDAANGGNFTDCTATYDSGGYTIASDANDRVTVTATNAELSETISVTR